MATTNVATKTPLTEQPADPWGSSLDKLKEWDPKGAELLLRVGTNPWGQRRATAQGSGTDLPRTMLLLHQSRRSGHALPNPCRARRRCYAR